MILKVYHIHFITSIMQDFYFSLLEFFQLFKFLVQFGVENLIKLKLERRECSIFSYRVE